jgi:hypothetical protein
MFARANISLSSPESNTVIKDSIVSRVEDCRVKRLVELPSRAARRKGPTCVECTDILTQRPACVECRDISETPCVLEV